MEECVGKFVKKFGYDVQQSNEIAPGRYEVKENFFFFHKKMRDIRAWSLADGIDAIGIRGWKCRAEGSEEQMTLKN